MKRKTKTESGKRKAEKGKGRHCNTYNVIVQASSSLIGMQGQDRSSSSKSRSTWVGVKP